jgi:phosphonate transport system substrate-binding protein
MFKLNRLKKLVALLGVTILLATLLAACNETASPRPVAVPGAKLTQVRFGAIPAENATRAIENTRPFADALTQEMGIRVDVFVGNNYIAVVEALNSGKIDVALLAPFSYVLASSKYGLEAIAQQIGKGGATSYNSLIITSWRTGIKDLSGIKGKSFAFTDPASTSGYVVPRYFLTKNGINPDSDIRGSFVQSHDASVLGVLNGRTDVGAVASDVYDRLVTVGQIKPNEIIVLAKSDPIPNSAVVVRKDLNAEDKARIKAAFLAVGTKYPEAMQSITAEGFRDADDSVYNGLRNIAKELNLDLTKIK